MMEQESITWVGKSGKAVGYGIVSCIDKKPIQAELNVLPVAAEDFLVWLFVHETSASVELTRVTPKSYHSIVESKEIPPEDPPLAVQDYMTRSFPSYGSMTSFVITLPADRTCQ